MALRIGFTGGGGITETHALAARECTDVEVAVVGFCGRNQEKVAALAAEHGAEAFESLDDLLQADLDILMIGSPSGVHAEEGLDAVKRGVHVLVEKPIDVTTERADALIEAADAAGVRLGVLFQDRLKPALVHLKNALDEGALGKPLVASARVKWYRPPQYYTGSPWRGTQALDGGAALINQGIHTVDLVLWLLGPVKSVRALTATQIHDIEGEDAALALVEFASGAVATLEATTCAWPGFPRQVEISGTEGTVRIEGDDVVAADLKTPRPDLVVSGGEVVSGASSPKLESAAPHRRVLEDFVRSIQTGSPLACDGREGRRSLALVEAVYAAARTEGTKPR